MWTPEVGDWVIMPIDTLRHRDSYRHVLQVRPA